MGWYFLLWVPVATATALVFLLVASFSPSSSPAAAASGSAAAAGTAAAAEHSGFAQPRLAALSGLWVGLVGSGSTLVDKVRSPDSLPVALCTLNVTDDALLSITIRHGTGALCRCTGCCSACSV